MEQSLKRLNKDFPQSDISPSVRTPGLITHKNRSLIDFTNRDVLGLGFNKRVLRAMHEGIERDGLMTGQGRTVSLAQLEAENALALLLKKEASIIFSSKTQSLFTLLSCLCNENDLIVCSEHSPLPVSDIALLLGADISDKPVGEKFSFFISELFDPRTGELVQIPLSSQVILDVSEGLLLDEPIPPQSILFGDLGSLGFPSLGFVAGSLKLKSHILGLSKTLQRDGILPSFLFDGILASIEAIKPFDVEKIKLKLLSFETKSKALFHSVRLEQKPKNIESTGCFFEIASFHTKGKENHYLKIYPSIFHTEENLKAARTALDRILAG